MIVYQTISQSLKSKYSRSLLLQTISRLVKLATLSPLASILAPFTDMFLTISSLDLFIRFQGLLLIWAEV